MEAIHLDSRRKKGKCYEESLDKLGGSEATEQQELEWWVFPGTVWEDRLVGYWRVGTRATEIIPRLIGKRFGSGLGAKT